MNPVYIDTLVRNDLQTVIKAANTQAGINVFKRVSGDLMDNQLVCVLIVPDEAPIDTSGGQPGSRLQTRHGRFVLVCVGKDDPTTSRDAQDVAESLASEVEDCLFASTVPQAGVFRQTPILPTCNAFDIKVFRVTGIPEPTTGLRKPGIVVIHIEVTTATPEGQSSVPTQIA